MFPSLITISRCTTLNGPRREVHVLPWENDRTLSGYVKALVVGGVIVPVALHVIASDRMPWWPDTVSFAIAAGAVAVALVWKARADREMNRRFGKALNAVLRRPDRR